MKQKIIDILLAFKFYTFDSYILLFDSVLEHLYISKTIKIDTRLDATQDYSNRDLFLYSNFNAFTKNINNKPQDLFFNYFFSDYDKPYDSYKFKNGYDVLKVILKDKDLPSHNQAIFNELYELYYWWNFVRPLRLDKKEIANYNRLDFDKITQSDGILFYSTKNMQMYNNDKNLYRFEKIYTIEDMIMLQRLITISIQFPF